VDQKLRDGTWCVDHAKIAERNYFELVKLSQPLMSEVPDAASRKAGGGTVALGGRTAVAGAAVQMRALSEVSQSSLGPGTP
jgi:hypothetical protein